MAFSFGSGVYEEAARARVKKKDVLATLDSLLGLRVRINILRLNTEFIKIISYCKHYIHDLPCIRKTKRKTNLRESE